MNDIMNILIQLAVYGGCSIFSYGGDLPRQLCEVEPLDEMFINQREAHIYIEEDGYIKVFASFL